MKKRGDEEEEEEEKRKGWGEIILTCSCCLDLNWLQVLWSRVVLRKWLNLPNSQSDYSADSDSIHSQDEQLCGWEANRGHQLQNQVTTPAGALPVLRGTHSETFRTQYIKAKEIRVCVGTWNVAGELPPDDLNIGSWLDLSEPADIYVIGLQEIVPLNAGNIFGAEDNTPVPKWENIIRGNLNRMRSGKPIFKSYSDPPSPSRFNTCDDASNLEDLVGLQSKSVCDEEEIYPLDEEFPGIDKLGVASTTGENVMMNSNISASKAYAMSGMSGHQDLERQCSSPKMVARLNCLDSADCEETMEESFSLHKNKLQKAFSSTERIDQGWPVLPLNLAGNHILDKRYALKSDKSFKASKSFKTRNSLNLSMYQDNGELSETPLLKDFDLQSQESSPFVRIISKQMVGTFITIWVRRSLRKHIQNLEVSTVGVGVMGYIGNKGSISVSMSIYQTLFCFVCAHLTSGEREVDTVKRNADVQEIHRRTQFHSLSTIGLTRTILDHKRIIWLGDLNYRIDLPFEKTIELIVKKDWSTLAERDQLKRELRKGHVFEGWHENSLNFPPTYKYELNSDKYCGEDSEVGRRNPAWCDRVLSFGNGMRQLSYSRAELKLSDHRPVTASYLVEVEVWF